MLPLGVRIFAAARLVAVGTAALSPGLCRPSAAAPAAVLTVPDPHAFGEIAAVPQRYGSIFPENTRMLGAGCGAPVGGAVGGGVGVGRWGEVGLDDHFEGGAAPAGGAAFQAVGHGPAAVAVVEDGRYLGHAVARLAGADLAAAHLGGRRAPAAV